MSCTCIQYLKRFSVFCKYVDMERKSREVSTDLRHRLGTCSLPSNEGKLPQLEDGNCKASTEVTGVVHPCWHMVVLSKVCSTSWKKRLLSRKLQLVARKEKRLEPPTLLLSFF
jgi:hypothetical protein